MRHTILPLALIVAACRPPSPAIEPPSLAGCADPFTASRERIVDTIFVEVAPGYALRETPVPVLVEITELVANALALPKPLPMPAVAVAGGRDEMVVRQGFVGEVMVRLEKQDAVAGVSQSTLVSALDVALLDATRFAFANLSKAAWEQLKRVREPVVFTRLRTDGTAHDTSRTEVAATLPRARIAVTAVRVPLVRLSRRAAPTAQIRRPSYPSDMAAAGKDGRVTFEFVIGTDGYVVPGSLRLVGGTNVRFAAAAYRIFNDARYSPAMVESCPVPTLVQQPFIFKMP